MNKLYLLKLIENEDNHKLILALLYLGKFKEFYGASFPYPFKRKYQQHKFANGKFMREYPHVSYKKFRYMDWEPEVPRLQQILETKSLAFGNYRTDQFELLQQKLGKKFFGIHVHYSYKMRTYLINNLAERHAVNLMYNPNAGNKFDLSLRHVPITIKTEIYAKIFDRIPMLPYEIKPNPNASYNINLSDLFQVDKMYEHMNNLNIATESSLKYYNNWLRLQNNGSYLSRWNEEYI